MTDSRSDIKLPGGVTAVWHEPAGIEQKPASILLVHGWMSGAWQWGRLQPYLASRGYASLAINYRGHCGSRPVENLAAVGFEDYVEDALAAAETLGSPIVIGQSTGGLIAQKLAEVGAVQAAVLSCSVPPAGIEWKCGASTIEARRLESNRTRHEVVPPDRAEFDAFVYNRMPRELANEAFAKQVPESGRVLAQLFNQEIEVEETRVHCPVLSIAAADDKLVHPDVDLEIAGKYGGYAIVRPGSGHYGLVYEPGWEITANLVVSWLDSVAH